MIGSSPLRRCSMTILLLQTLTPAMPVTACLLVGNKPSIYAGENSLIGVVLRLSPVFPAGIGCETGEAFSCQTQTVLSICANRLRQNVTASDKSSNPHCFQSNTGYLPLWFASEPDELSQPSRVRKSP